MDSWVSFVLQEKLDNVHVPVADTAAESPVFVVVDICSVRLEELEDLEFSFTGSPLSGQGDVLVGEDDRGVLEEEFHDLDVTTSGGQTQRRVLFREAQVENPAVDDTASHIDQPTRAGIYHGLFDRVGSFGFDALLDDCDVVVVDSERKLRGHFVRHAW